MRAAERAFLLAALLGALQPRLAGACGTTVQVTPPGSIQSAIDGVPSPLPHDYCISVGTGTYYEELRIDGIDTAGFRLKIAAADLSAGSTLPVVQPLTGSTAAFIVMNDSVTIQGFQISSSSGGNSYGVVASSAYLRLDTIWYDTSPTPWFGGFRVSSHTTIANSSVMFINKPALEVFGGGLSITDSRFVGVPAISIDAGGGSVLLRDVDADDGGDSAISNSSGALIERTYMRGLSIVDSTATLITASFFKGSRVLSATRGRDFELSHSTLSARVAVTGTGGVVRISTNSILKMPVDAMIEISSPAADATVWITSNVVSPGVVNFHGPSVYGIKASGLMNGATIQDNSFLWRRGTGIGWTMEPPTGVWGFYIENSQGLVIERNRISNPVYMVGQIEAARFRNVDHSSFRYNDVHMVVHGYFLDIWAPVSFPAGIIVENGSNGFQLTNNVIFTSYTITAIEPRPQNSSSTLVVSADSQSGFRADYNDYFDPHKMYYFVWGGTGYTSLAAWQAASGQDVNSFSSGPLWKSTAAYAEDFHPLSMAGRYDPATGSFVADAAMSATIDAADPADPFVNEPAPNGGRANQGSYGNTAQASKSAQAPGALALAGVHSTSITVSWTPVTSSGYRLEASTTASFEAATVHLASTSAAGASQLTVEGLSSSATYYLRVGSLYEGGVIYAVAGSTRTMPPLPAAPPAPAGTAAGVSSITWTWGAVAGALSYTVRPATAPETIIGAAATPEMTIGGLSPNATFAVVAAAVNETGPGEFSAPSAQVYTLAEPPSGTAAAAYISSTAIQWSLNGNPASTLAEVERSLDNAVFTLISSGAATPYADRGLAECTTYHYRVRYRNGDGLASGYDAVRSVRTGAVPPAAPSELQAIPLSGGRISLSWQPSLSTVSAYRLYWDAGAGAIDYAAALQVFTSTEVSWTTGVLASSAAYRFALRSLNCGGEETSGAHAVSVATSALAGARAAIRSPNAGKRIGGNRVTVLGELVEGAPETTRQVLFQQRAAGSHAWTDLVAAGANHPNPDETAPYFTHVDVTGWSAGSYELRAVAVDLNGSSDTAPAVISLTVDHADPEHSESMVGGRVERRQELSNAQTNTISAAGADAGDPAAKLVLPAGSLPVSTLTVTVVCDPVIPLALPEGFTSAGSAVDIDLSDGHHQLNGQALVSLSYPEGVDPRRLRVQSLDETTNTWSLLGTPIVDEANRRITAATTHFSIFVLVFGGQAAADLGGVRVYPNPFKPNDGDPDTGTPESGVVFDNLPAAFTIKVYTVSGREVASFSARDATGSVRWNASVPSGGYLAVISSPGHKDIVKRLLIVR